jgi:hypothetical protein
MTSINFRENAMQEAVMSWARKEDGRVRSKWRILLGNLSEKLCLDK